MSAVMPQPNPGAEAQERASDLVFEVSDLRAGYGTVPVLHGVSLALMAGEALGIVGHNGMGKTTLLKALMGLLPVTSGRISVDGVDITREPAHARNRLGIAYVPQGRGILPGLTTLDNLRLAWNNDPEETEHEALDRVLALFPRLTHLLDRRGGALSGGEQQLLALARALMPSPWMLLLDEPSEGIQPSIVQEIGQILAGLRADTGMTMIIVEQNLDLVLDVATRIAVLEKGRIAQTLSTSEVGGGQLAHILGLGAARVSRGAAPVPPQIPAQVERPAVPAPAAPRLAAPQAPPAYTEYRTPQPVAPAALRAHQLPRVTLWQPSSGRPSSK
jgi:amidase